jgi:glutaminyl-peptide cyclotransferase
MYFITFDSRSTGVTVVDDPRHLRREKSCVSINDVGTRQPRKGVRKQRLTGYVLGALSIAISGCVEATSTITSRVSASPATTSKVSAGGANAGGAVLPKAFTVEVTKQYPHDSTCFTQGLQFTASVKGGGFYESCGELGTSKMRLTSLQGKVLKEEKIAKAFAEGSVVLGNKLYQLTWKERVVYVRDPKTLKLLESRDLPQEIAEGWGITARGNELLVSDGSASIFFVDPKSFAVTSSVTVKNAGQPVTQLNELEFFNGELWANVWLTEQIVVINTKTGDVTATVSLAGLRPKETQGDVNAVANGIAFDSKTKRIFVTGKLWPILYQITTKPA